MNASWLVFGAVALTGAAWALVLYNGLVRLRAEIDRALANIDVLLKQRADEIPRLIEVCRGYAAHEQATLEAVTKAREALAGAEGPTARNAADQALQGALRGLFARVEQLPALRADALYQRLATRITALEDDIADRRELLNATVVRYNTRLETVPDLYLARWGGFTPRRGLAVPPRITASR